MPFMRVDVTRCSARNNSSPAWTQLGIAQRTVEHPAVFTVEEAKALRGDLPGHHVKNLFLRNKKEEMWLVVALEDRAIDLKRLGEVLGAGRLSFGSAERLKRHLGVEPGSVTPLALINDEGRAVRLALDRGLGDGGAGQCPSAGQHHDDGDGRRRPAALLRRPPAMRRAGSTFRSDVIL